MKEEKAEDDLLMLMPVDDIVLTRKAGDAGHAGDVIEGHADDEEEEAAVKEEEEEDAGHAGDVIEKLPHWEDVESCCSYIEPEPADNEGHEGYQEDEEGHEENDELRIDPYDDMPRTMADMKRRYATIYSETEIEYYFLNARKIEDEEEEVAVKEEEDEEAAVKEEEGEVDVVRERAQFVADVVRERKVTARALQIEEAAVKEEEYTEDETGAAAEAGAAADHDLLMLVPVSDIVVLRKGDPSAIDDH